MNRIYLLMLLFITCSIHVIAQTDYYYYQGNKIPLTLNKDKVIVSISKDSDEICGRIRANVQVLNTINDETFDIFVITRSDFDKLTSQDSWEEDSKFVILTSSYFTEDNKEVFATPYLTVRLKNEQDIDLLTSYAEMYKLRIVGNSQYLTLWYVLALTLDSDKNPLECANEIFESGEFASSVPDLASGDWVSTVRNITTAKTNGLSIIYDLQGHRLSNGQALPSRHGVFIRDGKKILR